MMAKPEMGPRVKHCNCNVVEDVVRCTLSQCTVLGIFMCMPCCSVARLGWALSYCFTVERGGKLKICCVPPRRVSRRAATWCRDCGPVMNIVGVPHAPSLVPGSRACCKHYMWAENPAGQGEKLNISQIGLNQFSRKMKGPAMYVWDCCQ